MVNFDMDSPEQQLAHKIGQRAAALAKQFDITYYAVEVMMDVTATHRNGCQLDLQKLLDAPEHDFAHDVFGIRRHLNRKTGRLEDGFTPRCAVVPARRRA